MAGSCMNGPTREVMLAWVTKARSDWTTVEILLASGRAPGEAIGFHCQQYVEKLVKAVLTYAGVEAPKTHDLRRLIQLTVPSAPELSAFAEAADSLTAYGVQTRYPGDWRQMGPDETDKAVRLAREIGVLLLSKIEQWTKLS
jgi:HEPN domain-containing protein